MLAATWDARTAGCLKSANRARPAVANSANTWSVIVALVVLRPGEHTHCSRAHAAATVKSALASPLADPAERATLPVGALTGFASVAVLAGLELV